MFILNIRRFVWDIKITERRLLFQRQKLWFSKWTFSLVFMITLFFLYWTTFIWCSVFVGWNLVLGFRWYSLPFNLHIIYYFFAFSHAKDIQYVVVHLNISHIFMFTLHEYIMYIKWGINLTLFSIYEAKYFLYNLYANKLLFRMIFD